MTGLKSGSGDDLWGDDGDGDGGNDSDDGNDSNDEEANAPAKEEEPTERTADPVTERESSDQAEPAADSTGATETTETTDATESPETTDSAEVTEPTKGGDETPTPGVDATTMKAGSIGGSQSYIVRRAVQDKSVQFERDERLTFFVHDDVADGERDLITDLQSALGRDVPKFDVREAVYRAALQNPDDVLEELLKMGYSLDEE